MRLYFVQHGAAVPEQVDPKRPLSDAGRHEVLKVAWALQRAAVKPAAVYHSGKLRAAQTAQLFADELGLAAVRAREGMNPKDDAEAFVAAVAEDEAMFVGHLPHLQRVVSRLLGADPDRSLLAWRNAGVLCLDGDGTDWRVRWYLVPENC